MRDGSGFKLTDSSLTTFIGINRLAMSAVSGAEPVSPAQEKRKAPANVLAQLVHSVRYEKRDFNGSEGGIRTPCILVRYFIGMSGLVLTVSNRHSSRRAYGGHSP